MVKRYQRGNKKQYIREGHSIQWSKDIKEVIRNIHQRRTFNTMVKIYKRGNKKHYIKEEHSIQWSKDTKEVIRKSISKKDIQYNGQKIPKRL